MLVPTEARSGWLNPWGWSSRKLSVLGAGIQTLVLFKSKRSVGSVICSAPLLYFEDWKQFEVYEDVCSGTHECAGAHGGQMLTSRVLVLIPGLPET